MRILNKNFFFVRLVFLLASLLFVSCSPVHNAEDTSIQEAREAADSAFTSTFHDFFNEEMKKSSFHTHFYLPEDRTVEIGEASSIFVPISLASIQSDIVKAKEYQQLLASIDYFTLNSDNRLLYDIMSEHLKTRLMLEGIEIYYEPLIPGTGIQAVLPSLFFEYEFEDTNDIENYLTALSNIDTYFEEILTFEKEKANFGSFMSDSACKLVVSNLDSYILSPNNHFLIQSFNDKMLAFKDILTPEVYEDYIAKNQSYVENDFHNAYTLLSAGLREIKDSDKGIDPYKENNKTKYFSYLVQTKTYAALGDINNLLTEIESDIDTDIKSLAKLLENTDTAYDVPALAIGTATTDTSIVGYEHLIEALRASTSDAFPVPKDFSYEVRLLSNTLSHALPEAFYFSPSLEQTRNIIYINAHKMQGQSSYDIISSLAHEALPGHALQRNHFIKKDYPTIRKYLVNPAFAEGWALYCETILPDLYDEAYRDALQSFVYQNRLNISLYAYIDISIHYYGATKENIREFLNTHSGIQNTEIIDALYATIEANPCHYLMHYLGYREIMKMKQKAMETLGEKYSDYDFHTWLLDMGPAPFNIIKRHFDIYLNLYK